MQLLQQPQQQQQQEGHTEEIIMHWNFKENDLEKTVRVCAGERQPDYLGDGKIEAEKKKRDVDGERIQRVRFILASLHFSSLLFSSGPDKRIIVRHEDLTYLAESVY